MSQANMDLGIFQETKPTDGIYTRGSARYSVVATDASSRHRDGVEIFQLPAPHFVVEEVQQFGPNVIGFQLVTGARRWCIVGCYLAPDDTSTIERFVEALRERPKEAELLVEGDLNINFAAPEGDRREEDIAATLTTEGLEYMAPHFLPRRRHWCRDRRTWGMLRKGRELRYRTDYILGTDRRLFGDVSVWDPRNNSDHYMVLGCLPSASLTEHKRYLGVQNKWPLRPPTKPTREDGAFVALRRAVPKANAREERRNEWISAETWRLVDKRVSARRDPVNGQALRRRLGRAIKASFVRSLSPICRQARLDCASQPSA